MPLFPQGGGLFPNSIDNVLLADMAAGTFKGRAIGAGLGDPQDLPFEQIGAWPLLATLVAAPSSAQLDFTLFDPTRFSSYRCDLLNFKPVTDAVGIILRGSANGGVSYDTAANYGFDYSYSHSGASGAATGAGGQVAIYTASTFGNNNSYGSGFIEIIPNVALNITNVLFRIRSMQSSGVQYSMYGGGVWGGGAMNAFRLAMSAGLIATATMLVRGVPK